MQSRCAVREACREIDLRIVAAWGRREHDFADVTRLSNAPALNQIGRQFWQPVLL